jgi:Methyltransferase FkbM domain
MNKYLFPIYRIIVPKPLRTIILKKNLRKKILCYYASLPEDEVNTDHREVLEYLLNNEVRIFPYPFHNNYSPGQIEVKYDSKKDLRYVIQEGKRLYFKKRWGAGRIKKACSDLMREQDYNSPHRYLSDSFQAEGNDILADIGAAEGNFSLSVIERVKKIYLFEYDREWIDALRATFEPWQDKVEIIAKYVSGINDESHIRFDTFIGNHKDVNFLKIDVDGAESEVLESCKELFSAGGPLKIALCTYHKNNDEKDFITLLNDYGFTVTPSKGYMINYYDKKIKAPYLRRGLIRAIK